MLMQIRQNVKCAQQLGELEKLIRFIKNYDSLLKTGQLENYYESCKIVTVFKNNLLWVTS